MWQRFTEEARRAVFFAQQEASSAGEVNVATEHLLLGLIREPNSIVARILEEMGVPPERVRAEMERQQTRSEPALIQDMQLTPLTKRIIDLAYDEARQLASDHIGAEHLLLATVREGEGLAGRVLLNLGVTLDPLRELVVRLQPGASEPGRASGNREAHRIVPRLAEVVRQFGEDSGWLRRSLVTLADVSGEDFRKVLTAAYTLKALHEDRTRQLRWSYPRTLAMIFEKPSLRTRVSFEAGIAHLGGQAIYLAPSDIGLGTREPVAHVAMALSRWADALSARVMKHQTVVDLAANATVPVINALSDREHPVQAFADLMTLEEHKGPLGPALKLAYIGDGNNVLHALLLGCAKMGVNLSAACPEGFMPDLEYVRMAIEAGLTTGARISVGSHPEEAVQGADAVYTDVWTSMGQEAETQSRRSVFAPYQINAELMAHAKPDALVLHCLPAHCGEEITGDVFEQHKIAIMDQAENRMHTQKALLALMIGM